MGKEQRRRRKHLHIFIAGILIITAPVCGCARMFQNVAMEPDFKRAKQLMKQGNYTDSLYEYNKMIQQYPLAGDKVLFEMGSIYALPANPQKDYQKSLDCFQKLAKDYPFSQYRQGSDILISVLSEIVNKDNIVVSKQKKIEALEEKIAELEKKIEQLKIIDMKLNLKKQPTN